MGRPGTTNKYDAQLCYLEIPKHVDMLSCWCLVKPNPVEICQDVSVWSLGALGTSKLWKIIKQYEHTWKTHTHTRNKCLRICCPTSKLFAWRLGKWLCGNTKKQPQPLQHYLGSLGYLGIPPWIRWKCTSFVTRNPKSHVSKILRNLNEGPESRERLTRHLRRIRGSGNGSMKIQKEITATSPTQGEHGFPRGPLAPWVPI